MKFIDEVDIELVNQELNFQSQDNNLVIKGGCDLFTTKPIGSDRKLFKTIDKHLDQLMEEQQHSHSLEKERQHSINSLFGSSASSPVLSKHPRRRSSSHSHTNERRQSSTSNKFNLLSSSNTPISELNADTSYEAIEFEDSPFGPLNNTTTRKTFAYLIGILNSTYPDHDFSSLQPTTDNFHKLNSAEELIHKFNNIMVSLGKKEDLLNWIWDTVNAYMDFTPPKVSPMNGHSSRHNSFSHSGTDTKNSVSSNNQESPFNLQNYDNCQIFEFKPSDESIFEDLNFPYQTMWSYYWFIYNKKKKRVSFLYLNAINKIHYSNINNNGIIASEKNNGQSINTRNSNIVQDAEDDSPSNFDGEYEDDINMDSDVIGDIEI